MPVTVRNLGGNAGVLHSSPVVLDMDTATAQLGVAIVDNVRDIKLHEIFFHYTVATNDGTLQDVHIGTQAAATKYLDAEPTASTAVGTVETKTPASTDVLPAGTALLVQAEAASKTNTGTVTVVVTYSYAS